MTIEAAQACVMMLNILVTGTTSVLEGWQSTYHTLGRSFRHRAAHYSQSLLTSVQSHAILGIGTLG